MNVICGLALYFRLSRTRLVIEKVCRIKTMLPRHGSERAREAEGVLEAP